MKHYLTGFILILTGLYACNEKKSEIITYDLKPRNFVEKIYSAGTLESANNYTIFAPTLSVSSVKVAKLIPEGSHVHKGDTICILEAPDLHKYYDRYYEELEKVKADQAKQEANHALQTSLLMAKIEENKARMEISWLDSIQIKFAPPVKQRIMKLEMEKNFIQEQKLLKKLEAQKIINEQTIRALKSQIIQKEQLVQRYQEQLDKLIIEATRDGMLVYAESPYSRVIYASGGSTSFGGNLKIGSTVRRRMSLFHLPDLTDLQVVLMVPEADYKRIEKDQKVLIRPEALKGLVTTGVVSKISLVGQKLDYKSKIKSYKITISVDSCDTQMLPGLSANCEIIVHKINDTIVVPTMAIYEKDSSKIVYVSKGDLFIPQIIEIGLSNRSETIVTSGLRGKETIALIEPPMNFIEKQKKKTDE